MSRLEAATRVELNAVRVPDRMDRRLQLDMFLSGPWMLELAPPRPNKDVMGAAVG